MRRPTDEADGVDSSPPRRHRKRKSLVGAVLAAAVALTLLTTGWGIATLFQSPAQVAAAASPPPPSDVTAPVEQGDLRDEINAQGEVHRASTQSVILAEADGTTVVTKTPVGDGAAISAGVVLIELSGEPVFALPGTFPLYRDISLGESGPDVTQLQEGLRAAGFDVTVDGELGASTRKAVERLYARAGYTAPSARNSSVAAPSPSPSPGADASPAPDVPVVVKAAAFTTISQLPAYVLSIPTVGTSGDDARTVTVASGPLHAFATVTTTTSTAITVGMKGTVGTATGESADVTVAAIGTADKDGSVIVDLAPTGDAIADSMQGQTIVISLTRTLLAQDALLVPTRAVVPRGASGQVVRRQNADGTFTEVQVREVATLAGRSAVQPVDDTALTVGDQVKVQ
jgi:peptidoglycan hydrolase-like protein with peptidoglycan-binding domain